LQRIKYYTIDLTKIDGKGEFRCPRCGTEMSPDDETEDVYTILETATKEDWLEKIIPQCNKCRSRIHLTGFDFLDETR
jgi:phage terminase large subunit GpA-like protein